MMSENYPFLQLSKVAEKESWRKEINRPIYHIHKWWAQRLGSVFRGILLYLIQDGSHDLWTEFYKKHDYHDTVVLDPFMGSGTTIGESLKLGARAIGCDINPISSFLVQQELTRVEIKALKEEYKKLENTVAKIIQSYYRTIDLETGKEVPVLYYFWVKLVETPDGEEIPLFSRYVFSQNAYPSKKPDAQIICPKCGSVFGGKYNDTESICPNCNYVFNPQKGPAANTTVTGNSGKVYKIKDLVPSDGSLLKEKMYAVMFVRPNGEKVYQRIQDYDLRLYEKAAVELTKVEQFIPSYEVRPGYNTDQARGYNYNHWKDFFNKRQLYCLGILLKAVLSIENKNIREQFLCLFSSTLEFNNTFCSYKGEGTGAVRPIFSNHILKPERTPLENSIWGLKNSSGCFSTLFRSRLLKAKEYLDEPFEIKIDAASGKSSKIIASNPLCPSVSLDWDDFQSKNSSALILNGDSANLPIPSKSVDFIVTDPPYFDFIHYSELSDFFYAWLSPVLKDRYTFFSSNTSGRKNEVQQKDAAVFSRLLGNVFAEGNRVLKNNGKMAFTFHHSRIDGWLAIADALKQGNFNVVETFPVHAELMASTPKAGAKEPISLDAIIICQKNAISIKVYSIKNRVLELIKLLESDGKKLTLTDIFVVSASQCLITCVNQNLNDQKSTELMQKTYEEVLDALKFPTNCG